MMCIDMSERLDDYCLYRSVAFRTVSCCEDELDDGRSLRLKSLLSEYFDKRCERSGVPAPEDCEGFDKYKVKPGKRIPNPPHPPSGVGTNALSSVPAGFQILDWEDQIRADIRGFLASRSDEKFSGRAVARILHGIGEAYKSNIGFESPRNNVTFSRKHKHRVMLQ